MGTVKKVKIWEFIAIKRKKAEDRETQQEDTESMSQGKEL